MANCAGLAAWAAASDIDADVKLAGAIRHRQRLHHDGTQDVCWKISFKSAAIDRDFAGAICKADAGDGSFAASCSEKFLKFFCHKKVLIISLEREWLAVEPNEDVGCLCKL